MPVDNPETIGGIGGVVAAILTSVFALLKSSGKRDDVVSAKEITDAIALAMSPLAESINRLTNEMGKYRDESRTGMEKLRDQMFENSTKTSEQIYTLALAIAKGKNE